jgi:hypothetical protein
MSIKQGNIGTSPLLKRRGKRERKISPNSGSISHQEAENHYRTSADLLSRIGRPLCAG